jgi:hypothetical protein
MDLDGVSIGLKAFRSSRTTATNNGDTPPDSIAKDILARLNSEFAKKRDIAAAGEDPEVTARIDPTELTPHLTKALKPAQVRFMHAHYARAGPPLRWIYKGSQVWPDGSTTYSSRVLFHNGFALLVAATIARNGKFANVDTQYD